MISKLEFPAMGCSMIGIVDAEGADADLQALPAQFEQWEQALSRFRLDSELCDLNRRAGSTVAVSQILWNVFDAARQAEVETRGLVNPLIGDPLIQAGYDRTFEELQPTAVLGGYVQTASSIPVLSEVAVSRYQHLLCIPKGARLDFGGVAKGWAAKQAVLALSPRGPALFNAGGDIAVSGPRAGGGPWEIAVDDPFRRGEHVASIYLDSGAVATSGKDYHRWMRAGAPQHHIIDPRTGLPAETDVLTATIIAPDAVLAEAFAKAILISGSDAGMAWLDSDERLAGLLVLENGQRLLSRRMSTYL